MKASAYHIRPRKGVFLFWGTENCARPDINKGMTGTQKSCEGRLQELLIEIRQELDRVVQKRSFCAAVIRNYVAQEIELLMKGDFVLAKGRLNLAHRTFFDPYTLDDSEDIHEALCALDLGAFACSLWVYWDEVEGVVRQIWQAKEVFSPYLDEAIRASYLFSLNLTWGMKPRWALYYALKTTNHMYLLFDSYSIHQNKTIGEVLPEAAVNRLRDILYVYARRQNRDGG